MGLDYASTIRTSGFTIYDPIEIGDPALWIPTPQLEEILEAALIGVSLAGLAIRTRSKVAKELVCKALGYPVPSSFKRAQPRFPGQQFDTYVQKANNLQVWNEGLSSTRRYVLIRPDGEGIIRRVKVVTGEDLAPLDRTGTLTRKYQAQLVPSIAPAELISDVDTDRLDPFVRKTAELGRLIKPTDNPSGGLILPISEIYRRLKSLVGGSFEDAGCDQERNRGAALHELVCRRLGYADYRDNGRFPDIRQQLLEVKLQTSPTIDLGLVSPNSDAPLDIPQIGGRQVRHCDVRYAIFYARIDTGLVTLTNFYLVTGEAFFSRFSRFGGKVINSKIQLPLPSRFFD